MLSISEADTFFNAHPLGSVYLEFSESERSAALTVASGDVAAALGVAVLPENPERHISAAVFEQMIFLLLNPGHLTGEKQMPGNDNLSNRARALLFTFFRNCRVQRG